MENNLFGIENKCFGLNAFSKTIIINKLSKLGNYLKNIVQWYNFDIFWKVVRLYDNILSNDEFNFYYIMFL